ncbi:potassium transporter [Planctomycetales bacterium]|nr:potassium transporter [Planctomycetales bacterium]
MNYSFVFRQLSACCLLLCASTALCLPWSSPLCGGNWHNEVKGFFGLLGSMGVCFLFAVCFQQLSWFFGKNLNDTQRSFFAKKEAIAVVGLAWILATILGALPFLFSGVQRAEGVPMSICDALFESQSGFSTTGATVFKELERSDLLPRCIMFWRCITHFLGGLGIVVLFVILLGYGTGTKKMLRSESSGFSNNIPKFSIRQLAKTVFWIYVSMNVVQTAILVLLGVPLFDALCHSFSTVSTGGFSTFNAGAGHFAAHGYTFASVIEWTFIIFMFLGGTSFILLYYLFTGTPKHLLCDEEWRVYAGIIIITSAVIFISGLIHKDFDNYGTADIPVYSSNTAQAENGKKPALETIPWHKSFQTAVFQVVSLTTTTGLCTDEYEKWSGLSCGILLFLIFIGGCSGSTSGGFKIIRAICIGKALPQEIELTYRPNVVRILFINGKPIERDTVRQVFVHFAVLAAVFVIGVMLILAVEPSAAWGVNSVAGERKLIDASSAVLSCLINAGTGFGLIGARQHYGIFSDVSKFILTWLMLLGRLELFVVLAMFQPGFWKK